MSYKFSKRGLSTSALFIFSITVLWQIIRYFVSGKFNFVIVVGVFLGTAPLALLNYIYARHKKDNTPDVDERTRQNIFKFIAITSQIIFLIFMATTAVLYFAGIDSIPIIYLWIVAFLSMLVIGIGSMIVMKK